MTGLIELAITAVSVVLLIAGASKLASPGSLARSVPLVTGHQYSSQFSRALARAVGLVELAIVVLLAIPVTARAAAAVGVIVGLGIIGWVGLASRQQVQVACGCFGGNSERPLGAVNAGYGVALAAGFILVLLAGRPADGLSSADQLSLVSLAALAIVLSLRAGDFYPLIRKGLGPVR